MGKIRVDKTPFSLGKFFEPSSHEALLVIWLESGPNFFKDLHRLRRFLKHRRCKDHWDFISLPFQGDSSKFESSGCQVFLCVPPDPDAPEGYPIRDAILQLMDHFNVSVIKIAGYDIGETEI